MMTMFMNPVGVAVLAAIAIVYLLYKNWDKVKILISNVLKGLSIFLLVVVICGKMFLAV